jgi:hypothetical protein
MGRPAEHGLGNEDYAARVCSHYPRRIQREVGAAGGCPGLPASASALAASLQDDVGGTTPMPPAERLSDRGATNTTHRDGSGTRPLR